MKIKATCDHCGRELLAEQLERTGGHCPWCGKAFTREYNANLLLALRRAEAAGDVLEGALEQVADIGPAFDVDEDSVLEPIRVSLRGQRRRTLKA